MSRSRAAAVLGPFTGTLAILLLAVTGIGCHRSDGDAQTSGQNVGGAIRDAGGKAVDGVKTGGEKAGAWIKGVGQGISGSDGG